MCLVSDKIKFCSCVSGSVENLKHFWIWYHYVNGSKEKYMGSTMMPTYMIDSDFIFNHTTLSERLNEPDAFDFPIQPLNNDLLEIVFNNNASDNKESFTYIFQFKKGKWMLSEANSLTITNHYKEEKSGKIKTALKRKSK